MFDRLLSEPTRADKRAGFANFEIDSAIMFTFVCFVLTVVSASGHSKNYSIGNWRSTCSGYHTSCSLIALAIVTRIWF